MEVVCLRTSAHVGLSVAGGRFSAIRWMGRPAGPKKRRMSCLLRN